MISRVAQHCHRVREVVKHSTDSTHDHRDGKSRSQCIGGLMVGLDLSRAFDLLSRSAGGCARGLAGGNSSGT